MLADETAPEFSESKLAVSTECQIVSVPDQELCVGWITETLSNVVGLGGKIQGKKQRYRAETQE